MRVINSIDDCVVDGITYYGQRLVIKHGGLITASYALNCEICKYQVTISSGVVTAHGIIAAISCLCIDEPQGHVRDCVYGIAMIKDGRMSRILEQRASISDMHGKIVQVMASLWANEDIVMYRSNLKKQLVVVRWQDILNGNIDKWTYYSVPKAMINKKVSSASLSKKSKIAIL